MASVASVDLSAPSTVAGAASKQKQPGGCQILTTNPLLFRDDIGRARPTAYKLPSETHTYGRPVITDRDETAEVAMQWMAHNPSQEPEDKTPDFIHMNRQATAAKVANAKDLMHFRNVTPSRDSAPSSARTPRKQIIPSDVSYGRKVRPATPMQDVIKGNYAAKAENDLNNFYQEFRSNQEQARNHVRKIPLTIASRAHAAAGKKTMQPDESKEPFKMTKFLKVKSRIDACGRQKSTKDEASAQDAADYVQCERRMALKSNEECTM